MVQPQIGDNVAVVLVVVRCVLEERVEARPLVTVVCWSGSLTISLRIGSLASCIGVSQRVDDFGLGLCARARPTATSLLAERQSTVAVLRGCNMIERLAETPNLGCRL